jgi:hypothetical protein
MKRRVGVSVAIVALLAGCGTAIAHAQGREPSYAAPVRTDGMRRDDAQRMRDGDRHQRPRREVVVVAVPVWVGPPVYGAYYAPVNAYRTLDGFYYYCATAGAYYPDVTDCPSGWSLVP